MSSGCATIATALDQSSGSGFSGGGAWSFMRRSLTRVEVTRIGQRGNRQAGGVDLFQWWPLAGADDLREELESAYAGAGRGYHDLRHLAEVFTRLDELAAGGVGF